jgi:hypothetical protein
MNRYLEILYVGRKIKLDPYEMLPDVISVDVRTGESEPKILIYEVIETLNQ